MSTLKTRDIKNSLTKKGFEENSARDHRYFFYKHNGKRTIIKTKMSHGKSEIGNPLISKMARDVKLSKDEFIRLINCTLSGSEYYEIIKREI